MFQIRSDLLPKVVAKITQIHPPRFLFWQKCNPYATKTHLRRNLEFCIDFVSISVPFSTNFRCFWASFFMKFWLVRRFRCFPNTLPLNLIRRSPLGVRRSTLCVYNMLLCSRWIRTDGQNRASKSRPVDPARPPWVATGRGPQFEGIALPPTTRSCKQGSPTRRT